MQHSDGRPHGSGSSLSRLACLKGLVSLNRDKMPHLDSTSDEVPCKIFA